MSCWEVRLLITFKQRSWSEVMLISRGVSIDTTLCFTAFSTSICKVKGGTLGVQQIWRHIDI